jgi:hypothetical protein
MASALFFLKLLAGPRLCQFAALRGPQKPPAAGNTSLPE